MGKFVLGIDYGFPEEWPVWLNANFRCRLRGSPVNELITTTKQTTLFWVDDNASN